MIFLYGLAIGIVAAIIFFAGYVAGMNDEKQFIKLTRDMDSAFTLDDFASGVPVWNKMMREYGFGDHK